MYNRRTFAVIGSLLAILIAAVVLFFTLGHSTQKVVTTTTTTTSTPGPITHINTALTNTALDLARTASRTALLAKRDVRATDVTAATANVAKIITITQNLGQNAAHPQVVVFTFHLIGEKIAHVICVSIPANPKQGPTPTTCS